MRLFIAVCFKVDVLVSHLSESFSTTGEIAFVWLHLQMNRVEVESQVFGSFEGGFTSRAAVLPNFQLRFGVSQNVSLQ